MNVTLFLEGFWLAPYESKPKNQDLKIADQNSKNGLVQMEIGTRGFLGLLIENLISKFSNTEWLFQYGGLK